MHSLGAVILAFIGTVLMQTVLGTISYFLLGPMLSSVGPLIPTVLVFGLTGFAFYGGSIFALGVVPKSNPKIVVGAIIAMVLVGTSVQIYRNSNDQPVIVYFLQLLTGAGAIVGAFAAKAIGREGEA